MADDIDTLLEEFAGRLRAAMRKEIVEELVSQVAEGKANGKAKPKGKAGRAIGYHRVGAKRGAKTFKMRNPELIAKIAEKLFHAIKKTPGIRMEEINVGHTSKECILPMKKLIAAKRVRRVGTRNAAKYFPVS